MKPPKRVFEKGNYEQVKVNEFIPGIIEEIKLDEEHKSSFKGQEKVRPAVRFKFKLEGYERPHYSRWLTFNYDERSNLFKKFLVPLVKDVVPNMDFDLDNLVGFPIKTFWTQQDEYQNLELIVPLGEKLSLKGNKKVAPTDADEVM